MDPSSSARSLHLAMAAFLGASLMAVSAFYIHKRTVDQVLQRIIEIRRSPARSSDEPEQDDEERHNNDGGAGGGGDRRERHRSDAGGTDIERNKDSARILSRSPVDENALRSRRISGSLPNVASSSRSDWFDEQSEARASSADNLKFALPRLPPLRMDRREGMYSIA